ncbi:hypothetical protein BH09BAC4_BH09BAC4_02040 [soil metagenome]
MPLRFQSDYENKPDSSPKKGEDPVAASNQECIQLKYDKEWFIRQTFETDPQKGCELLFRLYYDAMCSYAVRFVCSKNIAEDVVSDIFYTFWKNQSYLAVKSSYRAYLFRSVQNRCYNFLTNELQNIDSLDSMVEYDFPSSELPERLMYFEELSQKINKIVEGLSPQCQKVFILNRFENKKIQEIAKELNLSSRTIEAHISKALMALRAGLKDHWVWTILITLHQFLPQ